MIEKTLTIILFYAYLINAFLPIVACTTERVFNFMFIRDNITCDGLWLTYQNAKYRRLAAINDGGDMLLSWILMDVIVLAMLLLSTIAAISNFASISIILVCMGVACIVRLITKFVKGRKCKN